jgi:ligand-binding sensor domain-containing protein
VSLLKNAVVENSFTTANSNLSQNWITGSVGVGEDVYLGTYGSGVLRMNSRFDVESFREFNNVRIEINPNAMLATKRGVYAGTAGQGLAFLPAGQQRWHFWKTGLPSANVTALAEDEGNLYVGTDNGLIRVPEREINL